MIGNGLSKAGGPPLVSVWGQKHRVEVILTSTSSIREYNLEWRLYWLPRVQHEGNNTEWRLYWPPRVQQEVKDGVEVVLTSTSSTRGKQDGVEVVLTFTSSTQEKQGGVGVVLTSTSSTREKQHGVEVVLTSIGYAWGREVQSMWPKPPSTKLSWLHHLCLLLIMFLARWSSRLTTDAKSMKQKIITTAVSYHAREMCTYTHIRGAQREEQRITMH